jgi:two-component system cell cycle sensor histidine kinase/response regulator CckA
MTNAEEKAFPRWILTALAAVLLIGVIGTAWLYYTQDQSERRRAEEELAVIAQLKVDQIAAWRHERLSDAGQIAESPFLARGISRFLSTPNDANAEYLHTQFRSLVSQSHYANVLLVDPDGRVRLSLNGANETHNGYQAALAAALYRSDRSDLR